MTKAGDCIVRFCGKLHAIPAAAFCVVLFIVQSAFMDYYLIHHISTAHLTWIAFDAVNLTLLTVCMYLARSALSESESNKNRSYSLAWISWLTMSIGVASKTIVIFNKFAVELEEDAPTFFGPNTLKTAIALGSCVFVLLLTTQHDAPLGSENRRYIEELTGTVVFDILDTVDILEILFDKDMQDLLWEGLREFILAVATLNLLLPTVPLLTLSRTGFGRHKLPRKLIYLHRLLLVLLINVPNMLVRMILWHGFSVGISPFTLKNIILICMTLYEFYEHKLEKYAEHQREEHEMEKQSGNGFDSPDKSNTQFSQNGLRGESRPAPNKDYATDGNYANKNPVFWDPAKEEDGRNSVPDFAIEQRIMTTI